MCVDEDEDRRGAVRVKVAKEVTSVYIGHNVLNGSEGSLDVRGIVHCKQNSSHDLQGEKEAYK